jgi:hypothetical protein
MKKGMAKRDMIAVIATAAIAVVVLIVAVPLKSSGILQAQFGASPVATKISYQGQLTDGGGNLLNANYDLEFRLWDAAVGGNQVGSTITKDSVPVSQGLFSVQLEVDKADFNGQALWLEVEASGEVLGPRQEILPVPYALRSLSPAPAFVKYDVPLAAGEYVVDVPSFAIDGWCQILLWTDGTLSAWGPGFVTSLSGAFCYMQNSSDGSWISGPPYSAAGMDFTGGRGVNGDGNAEQLFSAAGIVELLDDGAESSPNHWTVQFQPGSYYTPAVTQAAFYFCPVGRAPDF